MKTKVTFGVATMAILMLILGARPVRAQEGAAEPGRWEISAFPGGGLFFIGGSKGPDFKNYAVGASFTYNINQWLGVEGELGGGLGIIDQSFTFQGRRIQDVKPPHSVAYNGNVVYSFVGNARSVVPYAIGGIGGLTMFERRSVRPFGFTNDKTFLTGNVGGGVKWFLTPRWGVRGDYRFFGVKSKDDAPAFFGLNETRYGHRVTGGIILTGGR